MKFWRGISTHTVENPRQNTRYSGTVLLGTSQGHWWSNRRCVALERIDDRIVVHDLGLGVGSNRWVKYPLLPRDVFAATGMEIEGDFHAHEHSTIGQPALEVFAGAVSDLVSEVLVGKMNEKRLCRFAQQISALVATTPEERRKQAALVFDEAEVRRETVKGSREGRWELSSDNPRVRIYLACAPADVSEVEERLSRLVGS